MSCSGQQHHYRGWVTPAQLADAIRAAAVAELASRTAGLPDAGPPDAGPPDAGKPAAALPAEISLERPRSPEHGDYASNVALQLAAATGASPRELAAALAARLAAEPAIDDIQVAGPGFLNIRLSRAATASLAGVIAAKGEAYGRGTELAGQRINLEFVSANPTGPVTLASVRWAAVGDGLARLLRARGADVATEYYFNDAGAQIDRFAASLLAAARGEPTPDDGYAGAYIGEIAAAILAGQPDAADGPGGVPRGRRIAHARGDHVVAG
jgi:arginyl-tRNA synthetase